MIDSLNIKMPATENNSDDTEQTFTFNSSELKLNAAQMSLNQGKML